MIRVLLMACFGALCKLSFAQIDSSILLFQHVNVIDGFSKKPLRDVSVLIEKGKIKKIHKRLKSVPSAAIVINLSNKWVLPGFVDAHVHFTSFEAAHTAVAAGVTSARTMNCNHFIDVEMRNAHRNGRTDVPEIVAAGYQIRPDMPEDFFTDFPELIDLKPRIRGAENVRRIVRANISRGVNHIKILATERGGTPDTDPRRRTFTDEELAAIVDEARMAGIPVAAHAHGDEGGAAAVKAGVRSIEHGTFLTDHTLALMKAMNTFFTSTVSLAYVYDTLPFVKNSPVLLKNLMDVRKFATDAIQRAYKLGIPIVGGTDSDYSMVPGFNISKEAIGLAAMGLSPMDAIKTITSNSAQLLKIADHTGSIKKGYDADLIVVSQNPLEAIATLQNVQMVVNDGKVVVNKFAMN